jgi:hypothetical protein
VWSCTARHRMPSWSWPYRMSEVGARQLCCPRARRARAAGGPGVRVTGFSMLGCRIPSRGLEGRGNLEALASCARAAGPRARWVGVGFQALHARAAGELWGHLWRMHVLRVQGFRAQAEYRASCCVGTRPGPSTHAHPLHPHLSSHAHRGPHLSPPHHHTHTHPHARTRTLSRSSCSSNSLCGRSITTDPYMSTNRLRGEGGGGECCCACVYV